MLNSSAARSHKVSGCHNPLRSTISMEDCWIGKSFVFSIIISILGSVCHNWISYAISLLNTHLYHGCKQRGKGEMEGIGGKSKGILSSPFLLFPTAPLFARAARSKTLRLFGNAYCNETEFRKEL